MLVNCPAFRSIEHWQHEDPVQMEFGRQMTSGAYEESWTFVGMTLSEI